VVYHKKYLVADLRAPMAAVPAIAFLVEGERVRMKKYSICRETSSAPQEFSSPSLPDVNSDSHRNPLTCQCSRCTTITGFLRAEI
jgi:hypothetical protein